MSIFKTKGVVLKKEKLKDNAFIYTIFSYDYGKIKTMKKESNKEKPLDIGYIINFEIYLSEKLQILKIRNIKIIWQFNTENKSFSEINKFMELVSIILKNTPEKVSIYEIYNIFETIKSLKSIKEEKLVLAKLKTLSILGILNINNNNNVISKVLKFINNNNIKTIIKLTGINQEIINELDKISIVKQI